MPILLLLGIGCARAPSVEVDLAEALPGAEVLVETGLIALDRPESRRHLGAGWGPPVERAKLRWAFAPAATLSFTVLEPRPLTLELRGRPAPCLEDRPQIVTVVINGAAAGEIAMSRGAADYRLEVAGDAFVAGENELRLLFSDGCRLTQRAQSFAAGWEWLRVGEAVAAGRPSRDARGERPALLLPFGSQVSFYLSLPAAGRLAIDRISPWGEWSDPGRSATVLLETEPAGSAGVDVLDLLDGQARRKDIEADLSPGPATPIRVSLRAVRGNAAVAGEGGFRLLGPVVRFRGAPSGVPPPSAAGGASRRPNVILYLVDTLRADHLGIYGYDRPTSPRIDAFAREATIFTRAKAQSSWTRPSVATIFTGLHPLAHGVNERQHALPASLPTLAQLLRELGYRTVGVTANVNVFATFGFQRGFDEYEEMPYMRSAEVHQPSEVVNRSVFRHLDGLPADRPFFLFVHTMDPHTPYNAPARFRRLFGAPLADTELGSTENLQRVRRMEQRGEPTDHLKGDLTALYDAEIARNDDSFGALLDELRRRGLFEDSLIVFTSDHGEAFGAHGEWVHGTSLFNDMLDVPLIVKLPHGEGAGAVESRLVRHEDLLPTVLDYLGLEPMPGVRGRSMLLEGAADAEPGREVSFAYLRKDGMEIESAQVDDWKLIRYLVSGRPREDGLYHVAEDPLEELNLIRRNKLWRGYLDSELRLLRDNRTSPLETPEAIVDEEQLEQLRALGYIR